MGHIKKGYRLTRGGKVVKASRSRRKSQSEQALMHVYNPYCDMLLWPTPDLPDHLRSRRIWR